MKPSIYLFVILFFCLTLIMPVCPEDLKKTYSLKAVPLEQAIHSLAKQLQDSLDDKKIENFSVADFIGPGQVINKLGEHISDELFNQLFQTLTCDNFIERDQIHTLLNIMSEEQMPFFNQETTKGLGNFVGSHTLAFGKIAETADAYLVSARIGHIETRKILAVAMASIIKDKNNQKLQGIMKTASLTVTIMPPCGGTVSTGGKQTTLINGTAIVSGMPYGDAIVLIQPEKGYQPIRKEIRIASPRMSISLDIKKQTYDMTFQVIPPDAHLLVDGKKIQLTNGHAIIRAIPGGKHPYLATSSQQGYQNQTGYFDPEISNCCIVNLKTDNAINQAKDALHLKTLYALKKQDFTIKLQTNQPHFKIGDAITFSFVSEKNCYLQLIDVGANGTITQIFPNNFHRDSFIQANIRYEIPNETYEFEFTIAPPIGIERVYAIANTKRPLDIFPKDFDKNFFQTITRGTRTIEVKQVTQQIQESQLDAGSVCEFKIMD